MCFHGNNKFNINNTTVVSITTNNLNELNELILNNDKIILLEGCLYSSGRKISSGSLIEPADYHSFLTETVKLLCISNLDYKNINKIIYSNSHLRDFLKINSINNIGLTSGCFDILHQGHIQNLIICKKNCDKLFVCLSSDQQISRLKGNKRPINNINDRTKMLINFDFIDFVILYEETNDDLEIELDNIMNIIDPVTWFKGSDYTRENIIKKHPSIRNIKLIELIEGKSTTNIINKIIKKN
jgi:rfaE bifunctional protein nucleotidyltransferase chain/domain